MIQIREMSANENWQNIRNSFYQSLTSPFDGMWDEMVHDYSKLWGFYDDSQLVGYASKDASGNLINFFLIEKYGALKPDLFKRTLYLLETNQALVSTNNPDFLILSLDKSKKMAVHSYLFENKNEVDLPSPEAIKGQDVLLASKTDIQSLITFCSNNVEADPDWLATYIKRLVNRQEIHLLKKDDQIIGTCEVPKKYNPTFYHRFGSHRRYFIPR